MSTFTRMRRLKRNLLCGLGLALLAACSATGDQVQRGLPDTGSRPVVERVLSPDPSGEVIGNGKVRVALLVPLSIPGGAAAAARELRNGAELAMQDFGQGRLQLVVKDTRGQAAVAQEKADEAIAEGSSLLLGPLFAANVSASAGVTLPANLPILAFSTDTTVARRNVYLFSFTPQSDTMRLANYASSTGSRSIAAFLPRNAEGSLRARILQQAAGSGGFVVNVMQYDRTPQGIDAVISSAGPTIEGADSIYIPEGGPIPGLIVGGLKRKGINIASKRILGSGAWESVDTRDGNLEGAIYPGRDVSRFNEFATRYQGKFGATPGVQAALAYDAVTLLSELVRLNDGRNAFSTSNLENNRGFQGTTGAFRIRRDGTTQRGLAIYSIKSGKGTLVEPALSGFGRGNGS